MGSKTFWIAIDSIKKFPKVSMRYWETEPQPDEVQDMATWSKVYPHLQNVKVVFFVPGHKPTAIQRKACEAVVLTFVRSRL